MNDAVFFFWITFLTVDCTRNQRDVVLTERERSLSSRYGRLINSVFSVCCILPQFLTLSCWFVFVFKSFFIVLFDAKRTKNFCTRKVYSQVLFVHDASDHSVKHLLVMATHGLFAGCCETRSTRVFEKIYTRVALRQSRTMACKPHRLPLNTLTVQVSPLATSYPCC